MALICFSLSANDFRKAIVEGNVDAVREMIAEGQDVRLEFDDGWTPLATALTYSVRTEIVALLLDAGADPNKRNDYDSSHLDVLAAMSYGEPIDFELIDLLLEAGGDVNAKNFYGETPLFHTLSPSIAAYLVEQGADSSARSHSGRTPLMKPISLYRDPELVEVLVLSGLDVDARDQNGRTALMYASGGADLLDSWDYEYYYNPEFVLTLIDAGADVSIVDADGRNALHYAAYSSFEIATMFLLISGIDVNATDNDGTTALMIAAQHNRNPKVVQALLDYGADRSKLNAAGEHAAVIAVKSGNVPEIIEMLQSDGKQQ